MTLQSGDYKPLAGSLRIKVSTVSHNITIYVAEYRGQLYQRPF